MEVAAPEKRYTSTGLWETHAQPPLNPAPAARTGAIAPQSPGLPLRLTCVIPPHDDSRLRVGLPKAQLAAVCLSRRA